MSISLLIEPLILFDRNDLIVFSGSLESVIVCHSILSTANIKPLDPAWIRSVISKTPDACVVVENFLAIFSAIRKILNSQWVVLMVNSGTNILEMNW